MKRVRNYINECISELMTKVSWPSYKELQSSAIIVLVASLIIATLIFFMDSSLGWLLKAIYKI